MQDCYYWWALCGKNNRYELDSECIYRKRYTVLFIPETATELISGGVAPWSCSSNVEYQKCQLKLQIEKEKIFDYAAKTMNSEKILIVCDRGALDNKAYMTETDFAVALDYIGANEVELRDNYDAVFHLVTAAKGAEEFYTTANNAARTETIDEAAALDDRLIATWTGHPHLRIIDNASDFEDKMKHLISEIASFLGEPEPYEIERKYLIEYPNIKALEILPNCEKVEIIQTYLKSDDDGEEVRIRQRGSKGHYIYFEIDIYPFWMDKAIMEIELSEPNEEIRFPEMINVVREVTEDNQYKNSSLAML